MDHERRESPRVGMECEAKLWRPWVSSHLGCRTLDISETGCLLLVHALTPLRVGEEISLGLASPGHAVISRDNLIRARVVRAGGDALPEQPVGLRFEERYPQLVRSLAA